MTPPTQRTPESLEEALHLLRATRKAKEENDERFMRERDEAREERDAAVAEIEALRAELAALRGPPRARFDAEGNPLPLFEWALAMMRGPRLVPEAPETPDSTVLSLELAPLDREAADVLNDAKEPT